MALLSFPPSPNNNELYPANPLPGQSQYRFDSTTQTWVLEGAATAVAPGCYGDAYTVPTFCVDAQGRLTFAQNVAILTSGGTVTDVTAGFGLLGGTITTSGTISLDTSFTDSLYLQLAGGTMAGDIIFSGTQTFPAQDLQTVTTAGNTTTNGIDVAGLTAAGLIYPAADGTAGQAITTDGAGNLVWAPGLPDYSLAAPPQILGLDSGTGDPAWTSTLPFVAPPNLSSDPGTVGECAFDNVYFYMHDGIQWNRVAWDTTPW